MKDRVDLLWLRGERRWYDGAWEVPHLRSHLIERHKMVIVDIYTVAIVKLFTPILQGPTGQR